MKLMDITPYYHSQSGGIKTYLNNKIKWCEDKDVEHVVVIPGKKRNTYQVGRSRFYEVSSFKLIGGYRFFRSINEINNLIEAEKPDVVELGGTYILIPFLLKKDYLLSVFYHADAKREIELLLLPRVLRLGFFRIIIESCLKKADLILVPSLKYEKELKDYGLERLFYAPLGIDTKIFNPRKYSPAMREKIGVEEGVYLLIYSGRLSPEKGVKNLIKVLRYLPSKRYHLVIVGSGPLLSFIKAYKRRYKNLTLLSYLPQDELSLLYASADIFVSASEFETFGYAFLEAQASGLPVCAYDLDLETQILKECLAKEQTAQALAERIIETSYRLNHPLRFTLFQEVEKNFHVNDSFKKIFHIYHSMLSQKLSHRKDCVSFSKQQECLYFG